jgi:hypothetical protein
MPEEFFFTDEQFMSVAEKRKVIGAWIRFLKNGCVKSQFTESLYHHLSQHCSFIAHFDRFGFYDFYFARITPHLFRFLNQFDPELPGVSAEYGTTHWLSEDNTGGDLNRAMREAARPYLQGLRQKSEEIRRQSDIGAAARVLAQYGLAVVPATAPNAPIDIAKSACSVAGDPVQVELFTSEPVPEN